MKPPGGRQVSLTISGSQTDPDGNTQETSATCRALCFEYKDGHLFLYEENGERVRLFLSKTLAWTDRGKKDLSDRVNGLVFDPSVSSHQCFYETGYGRIPMEVRTKSITLMGGRRQMRQDSEKTFEEETGQQGFRLQARVKYSLWPDPKYEMKSTVTIKAQQID